jgi:hypothetical protein
MSPPHTHIRSSGLLRSSLSAPQVGRGAATTGGGALAVADLMCVSGASNTVLEVQMPYSQQAMAQLLGGHPPEQIVRRLTNSRFESQ